MFSSALNPIRFDNQCVLMTSTPPVLMKYEMTSHHLCSIQRIDNWQAT